jgi:hypothetical protein
VLRFRLMVKRDHRYTGPKHQKEKRSMDYFAGLDVSVKDTSVCIVDDAGRIVREVRVASEPDALQFLVHIPQLCWRLIALAYEWNVLRTAFALRQTSMLSDMGY